MSALCDVGGSVAHLGAGDCTAALQACRLLRLFTVSPCPAARRCPAVLASAMTTKPDESICSSHEGGSLRRTLAR